MRSDAAAPPDLRAIAGQRVLAELVGGADGLVGATAMLLVDALCAITFAAGVAGAVTVVAAGGSGVVPWLVVVAAAGGLRGVTAMTAGSIGDAVAGAAKAQLRAALIGSMLTRPTATHRADRTAGALMSLVVGEVEAIDLYLSRFVPARGAAVLAPLLLLAAVACASVVAAFVLAATLIPFVILMAVVGRASASASRRQFSALARLSGLFADRMRALPVVLAFRAGGRETERLATTAGEVARRTIDVLRLAFLSSAVLEFFSALCVALVAVYAGFNLLGLLPFPVPEKLDLARALFVLALAPEFYLPMRRLASAYHDRQAAQTAAERIAAFRGEADPAAPATQPVPAKSFIGPPRLRFAAVTLRYEGSDRDVVRDLNFDLRGGSMLAIVGPSGSGKTSVLRALLGLALVDSGEIWLGSERLDKGSSIADHAAWVGQTPLMIRGTLRDNLLLAAPLASEEALARAVSLVGLGPMLCNRSGGLEATVDARGSGLSGGERRRIALARALLKPAPIWLFDEPTSHLDEAAEVEMVACIRRARAGRTTIVATHSERLAAIADVVIRLDHTT